jgi:hypothetical protein
LERLTRVYCLEIVQEKISGFKKEPVSKLGIKFKMWNVILKFKVDYMDVKVDIGVYSKL